MLALAGCASDGEHLPPADVMVVAPAEPSPLGDYLAGRVARLERDTRSAAEFYAFALKGDPENPQLVGRTLTMMLAEGRMEDVFALANRRIDDQEADPLARLALALQALQKGGIEEARQHLLQSRQNGLASLLNPMIMAWLAEAEGNSKAAIDALSPLQEKEAFKAFYNFHAALLYDLAGDVANADKYYRETVGEEVRAATRVVLAYGAFLSRHDRKDEAEDLFDRYLVNFPENPVIVDAQEALKSGRDVPMPIRDALDGTAEALLGAAGALARDTTSQAAIMYLRLALHIRPNLAPGLMLLADILESDQRYSEANAIYRRVQPDSPYYWVARIRIAGNLNRLDKVDETLALLRGMAKERPSDTGALISVGDILRSRERYDEAVVAYDQALKRVGDHADRHWALYYARGIALERSKQWKRAESDFLKALELRPEHPLVLNYLGYSWIEQGLNLEKARKMVERAVEQRPGDGYIVDSLGWVLYRMGDYEQAVLHLERAVSLRPEDPIINDHLGDAYWRAGRRLEARFQWRHALALGAAPEDAKRIEEKLKNGLPAVKTGSDT